MVESTTRLWWIVQNQYQGPVIFQMIGGSVPQFARKFFSLLGIDARFVDARTGFRVRSLIIPAVAAVERGTVHEAFVTPFQHLAKSFETPSQSRRIFVSRGQGVGAVFGEGTVQKALQSEGFEVLDPTQATLEEQVAAFASATEIVGSVGSAMHNVVYCRNARRIAYISRSLAVSPTFPAIDGALNSYDSYYIYAALSPLPVHSGLRGPYLIDSENCCKGLASAGFIPANFRVDPRDLVDERDLYMAEWCRLQSSATERAGSVMQ
nr:glycosyltransferase family 61 protein [Jiella avicenniae]